MLCYTGKNWSANVAQTAETIPLPRVFDEADPTRLGAFAGFYSLSLDSLAAAVPLETGQQDTNHPAVTAGHPGAARIATAYGRVIDFRPSLEQSGIQTSAHAGPAIAGCVTTPH